MIRGSNASKETGFSLWQNIPNRSSSLVPEFLSVDKASGAWIWPLVSAQVKNECKCTFTRSRWFHVVERENFTFFIPFLSYLSFTFLLPFLYLSFTFCNASSFFLLFLLSFFFYLYVLTIFGFIHLYVMRSQITEGFIFMRVYILSARQLILLPSFLSLCVDLKNSQITELIFIRFWFGEFS